MSNPTGETNSPQSPSPEKNKTKTPSRNDSPLLGILAGLGVTAAGSALWILVAQKYQLTWMSAAVAFGIASAIKYAGRGTSFWYGLVGALLSLFAAVSGNLATAVFIIAKRGKTPMEIISQMDIGTAFTFLKALSGPLGLFFYAASLYIGFWFSFRHSSSIETIEVD